MGLKSESLGAEAACEVQKRCSHVPACRDCGPRPGHRGEGRKGVDFPYPHYFEKRDENGGRLRESLLVIRSRRRSRQPIPLASQRNEGDANIPKFRLSQCHSRLTPFPYAIFRPLKL